MNVPSEELLREWTLAWSDMRNAKPPIESPAQDMIRYLIGCSVDWATAQERERCAKLCEISAKSFAGHSDHSRGMWRGAMSCADSIRLPNGDGNEAK